MRTARTAALFTLAILFNCAIALADDTTGDGDRLPFDERQATTSRSCETTPPIFFVPREILADAETPLEVSWRVEEISQPLDFRVGFASQETGETTEQFVRVSQPGQYSARSNVPAGNYIVTIAAYHCNQDDFRHKPSRVTAAQIQAEVAPAIATGQ